MPIRRLDPHLVSQIAAGEVVDRPASVVKELLDNALDAGATRIDITLENGGIDLIRIRDNGYGIPAEELELAITQHATSKIQETADLAEIHTMGFRGEALASIASVTRFSLASKQAGSPAGAMIESMGDYEPVVKPWSGAPGTLVEARNLFFNTPARRRFLKAASTEVGHINAMVQTHAMAHPDVAFHVKHNRRVTLELETQSQRDRIISILGHDLEDAMIQCEGSQIEGQLWGLIADPSMLKSNSKSMYFYVNGRPVKDARLIHAVREAYRGLTDPRKYPVVVLFLTVNPAEIDVNVHPAKTEVRFFHHNALHHLVHASLRQALLKQDITPKAIIDTTPPEPSMTGSDQVNIHTEGARHYRPIPPNAQMLRHASSAGFGEYKGGYTNPQHSGSSRGSHTKPAIAASSMALVSQTSHFMESLSETKTDVRSTINEVDKQAAQAQDAPRAEVVTQPVQFLQIHDSYILTLDEQGLLLVDQHALHERLMYDKLIKRIRHHGSLPSQPMLIPAVASLEPTEMAWVQTLEPLFEQLGMDVRINDNEVEIHAFPVLLISRKVEPIKFLKELLEKSEAVEMRPSEEAALHQTLDMMACKAAVKANNALSEEEMSALIEERVQVECSGSCPHGRPTVVRLDMAYLPV